jgi:hypothetical protein
MANVHPKQIEEVKQLLSEHHAGHAQEHGRMDACQEPSCVEAKLGLRFLGNKLGPPQDSGSGTFNLK